MRGSKQKPTKAQILAKVGQLRLAKVGQILLAKVGLAKVGLSRGGWVAIAGTEGGLNLQSTHDAETLKKGPVVVIRVDEVVLQPVCQNTCQMRAARAVASSLLEMLHSHGGADIRKNRHQTSNIVRVFR